MAEKGKDGEDEQQQEDATELRFGKGNTCNSIDTPAILDYFIYDDSLPNNWTGRPQIIL